MSEDIKWVEDDAIVAQINWRIADIRCALVDKGYEDSDENVQKVLAAKHRLKRMLEERCIEEGWEIIYLALEDIDDLTLAKK